MPEHEPFTTREKAANATQLSAEVRIRFGQMLRRRRHKVGLLPANIEQITGIGASELRDIESGKSDPALATMAALAKALGCAVTSLLVGDG